MKIWILIAVATLVTAFSIGEAHALRLKDGQVVLDKLEDLKVCQQYSYTGEFCLDAFERWLKAHPDDFFAGAKIVRQTMNAHVAVPYFAKAMDHDGFCQDTDVKLSVLSALALPPENQDVIAQAQMIAFGACAADMKSEVKAQLTDSNVFANSCRDMAKLGMLGGLQTRKCEALN